MSDPTAARRFRRRAVWLLVAPLVLGAGATTAALAASQAPATSVALSVTPGTLSLVAGDQAGYDIALKRKSFAGPVTLSVSGLPAGASGAFAPATTTGDTSRLTVTTGPGTTAGTYPITVASTSSLGTSSVAVKLTVNQATQSSKPFAIKGNLTASFVPGSTVPLNMAVTNPNNQNMSVTNLNVNVSVAVTGAAGSCTPSANFAVAQLAATAYPVAVPANTTRSLSQAGVASSAWPTVRMLDTAVNQDGCKGATITLTYTGTAQGGN